MANHNDVSNHHDISGHVKSESAQRHVHPINRGVHPGTAKRSDFDANGVEVPARPARERVNPATANAQRRTPLIDVTAVVSEGHHSHLAEPVPSKL